jgi:hypothetical protein
VVVVVVVGIVDSNDSCNYYDDYKIVMVAVC